MHGIIFAELKKYVDANFPPDTWQQLLGAAGLGPRTYYPVQEYPDSEVGAIVGAASKATGTAPPAILDDFGHFIAPDLLAMYRALLKPEWRTLDVLEHTEETIHRVVRMRHPGARPPELKAERVSPSRVEIVYTSERKLCAVARGIVRGMARHFNESIAIEEPSCMLRGQPFCRIAVSLQSPA